MPLTYSRFAILILLNNILFGNGAPNSTSASTVAVKAILDPKRRNDLVDEAFLEQKDILLDMLEAKLKEVRDKKKKKNDQPENSAVGESNKCELLPDEVDLKLQASGIIAVGETDVQLKFGDTGNSNLNLNASGISNVGKTNLQLGIGNGTVNIPGLNNLFLGSSFLRGPCENRNAETKTGSVPSQLDIPSDNADDTEFHSSRRSMEFANMTNLTPPSPNKLTAEPLQRNISEVLPTPNAVNVQNVV